IPKLNQLKEEEKSLIEYRNVTAELERNSKIYTAYAYIQDKAAIENVDSEIQSREGFIEAKQEENTKLNLEYTETSKKMEELQEKLNEKIGGDLKQLESDLNSKRTVFERINTDIK